jgi:hypothetical protein
MTHFHSIQTGCDLVPARKEASNPKSPTRPRYLDYFRCEIHEAEVCRCGWEFGKHPVHALFTHEKM